MADEVTIGDILECQFNGTSVNEEYTQWTVLDATNKRIICENYTTKCEFTKRTNDDYVVKHQSRRNCYKLRYPRCQICTLRRRHISLTCQHSMCKLCLVNTAVKLGRRCPFCRETFAVPATLKNFFIKKMERELSLYRDMHNTID